MFSRIDQLEKNDSIFISGIDTTKTEYKIYDKYIASEDNLECTNNTQNVEVTLVTCSKNNNRKRIIIKAKMKEI